MFVRVQVRKQSAVLDRSSAGLERAQSPRGTADAGLLDLDDVGAEIGRGACRNIRPPTVSENSSTLTVL